jgi:hypothetical protein
VPGDEGLAVVVRVEEPGGDVAGKIEGTTPIVAW